MDKTRTYSLNAADIAAAFLVLLVSVIPLILFAGQGGRTAYVFLDGKEAGRLDMARPQTLTVAGVTVETSGGKARVLSSDCPRGICRHTGWISSTAQTIVCVPNKVLVEIKGNKTGRGIDAVSY